MRLLLFFCSWIMLLSPIYAQQWAASQKSELLKFFDLLTEEGQGHGSVSLFEDGEEIFRASYGYADPVNKTEANPETKYRIGSITKSFTAVLVMKLVEQNKLQLSTPLSEFYPIIPNAEKITINHLLRHQSGLFNITSADDYFDWHHKKKSKKQLLKKIIDRKPTFVPGSRTEYSNSNYILLTFLIEDFYDASFEAVVNEEIIKPLKLKNTYVGSNIDLDKGEVHSYQKLQEWKAEAETHMSVPRGAGNMVSTSTDLNTFYSALFKGEIVAKKTLDEMKDMEDGFGIGLVQVPFHEKKGYGHTGGIDGFQSNAFYFPESSLSIAITANGVEYPLNNIAIAMLSMYYGKGFEMPDFETVEVEAETLEKYVGVYSSPEFPLDITIERIGEILMAQATGQPQFKLTAVDENSFKFEAANLEMKFFPTEDLMRFTQAGQTFDLKRK